MRNESRRMAFIVVSVVVSAALWARLGHANAPVGHYEIKSGTVRDTKSNLTWEQIVLPGEYSWSGAENHCKTLMLDGSGWRLPSVKELHTIVDESRVVPTIDVNAFPDTASSRYWTSSPVVGLPSSRWVVYFSYGDSSNDDISGLHHVRCVR